MNLITPITRSLMYPAIGRIVGLPPPILDLNFGYQGGIPPWVLGGFTRGTVRRLHRSGDGRLVTLAANVFHSDHDPVTFRPRGLPIEEAMAANLLSKPEELDHADWIKSNDAEVTANSTISPDGATTADTITDNQSGSQSSVGQAVTVANDSADHVFSFYVLKDSNTDRFAEVDFRYAGGTQLDYRLRINTSTGAVDASLDDTPTASGSIDAGDYWRFFIVGANNSTGNTTLTIFISPAKSGTINGAGNNSTTGSIIAWGTHLGPGTFPTSYNGVSARSADLPTIALSDIPGWNSTKGMIFVDFNPDFVPPSNTFTTVVQIDDGDLTDAIRLFEANGPMRYNVRASSADQINLDVSGGWTAAAQKVAFTWDTNAFAISRGGDDNLTDTTGAVPSGLTTLRIGNSSTSGRELNGTMKRLIIWNQPIPGILPALTA